MAETTEVTMHEPQYPKESNSYLLIQGGIQRILELCGLYEPPEETVMISAQLAPVRVLVVEDEQAVSFMLAQVLEYAGYEPLIAQTFKEFTEILERQGVDLILLDLHLPDSGPDNTLENLDRLAQRSKNLAPVIVITGDSEPRLGVIAMGCGASWFLDKSEIRANLNVLPRTIEFVRAGHQRKNRVVDTAKEVLQQTEKVLSLLPVPGGTDEADPHGC